MAPRTVSSIIAGGGFRHASSKRPTVSRTVSSVNFVGKRALAAKRSNCSLVNDENLFESTNVKIGFRCSATEVVVGAKRVAHIEQTLVSVAANA